MAIGELTPLPAGVEDQRNYCDRQQQAPWDNDVVTIARPQPEAQKSQDYRYDIPGHVAPRIFDRPDPAIAEEVHEAGHRSHCCRDYRTGQCTEASRCPEWILAAPECQVTGKSRRKEADWQGDQHGVERMPTDLNSGGKPTKILRRSLALSKVITAAAMTLHLLRCKSQLRLELRQAHDPMSLSPIIASSVSGKIQCVPLMDASLSDEPQNERELILGGAGADKHGLSYLAHWHASEPAVTDNEVLFDCSVDGSSQRNRLAHHLSLLSFRIAHRKVLSTSKG